MQHNSNYVAQKLENVKLIKNKGVRMAGDGIIDGKFTIRSGQGLSQAIRDELGLTQEDCNNLGKSVWIQIFDQVKTQDQQTNIYHGGSDLQGDFRENFVVRKGQVIEFSKEIWANIVKLVNDKLNKNIQIVETPATETPTIPTTPTAVTVVEEDTDATDDDTAGINEQPEEPTVNAEQAKKDALSVKVTVPEPSITVQYNNSCREAYNIASELKSELQSNWVDQTKVKSTLEKLQKNPELLAMVVKEYGNGLAKDIDNVFGMGFGFDKEDFYNYVLEPLIIRNENLKKSGNTHLELNETINKDSSLEAMESAANSLANLIWNVSYNNATSAKNEQGRAQKAFDDANRFLAEVANTEPKPEIKSGTNRKQVTLPDGRYITAWFDCNGNIDQITISHDTAPDRREDGSTFDGIDISYTKDEADFDTDKSNAVYEGTIDKGYDFEKIKALAEKIFGKWEAAVE